MRWGLIIAAEAASQGQESSPLFPELWVRLDDAHPWGTRRCWKSINGAERVDLSKRLYVVNVANITKSDDMKYYGYMIVAVNEGEEEVPIPLGE